MSDLRLLAPELVLVTVALGLLAVARRITHARVVAAAVVLSTVGAMYAGLALTAQGVGFNGMIALDRYSQFFHLVFAATLLVTALLSIKHVDAERIRPAEYYSLLLLASTGMMLAASAVDLLVLYLGLELMTMCSYLLVGITRERSMSNEASLKYFLLGSFASAVLLYGIALSYGATGATDFTSIASTIAAGGDGQHGLLLAGVALVAVGLAFKIAAVPFHAWAPDAYQGASAPVAAFLAVGSKAAGLAALGRVFLVAFAPERDVWSQILLTLAALSMIGGSLLALSQLNMKRLLAYSSIAHAGYALLGLISGTPDGISATMSYAFIYAFMTLGAFGVVIGLGQRGEELSGYHGLAATSPWTAAVMFLFLLSLTGIPPTAGFAAKFAVILSIVKSGHVTLAVLAVACSVVSAFFYLRIAVLMYMTEPQESVPTRFPAGVSVALALAAFVTLVGGIFPDTISRWSVPP